MPKDYKCKEAILANSQWDQVGIGFPKRCQKTVSKQGNNTRELTVGLGKNQVSQKTESERAILDQVSQNEIYFLRKNHSINFFKAHLRRFLTDFKFSKKSERI